MDSNWRAALAQDSRQMIVNRIMDTLQRHMPVSGQDGMNELRKIAWRFEEKIFQAATDQHDYLRKVSLKMLSLETKAQNGANNTLSTSTNGASQNTGKPLDPASLDLSSQIGQSGIIDPQDIVWAKMQVLKEKYLHDMRDLFSMLMTRSQQPMPLEQLQKLSLYKSVLQRMIPYLVAPKGGLPKEFKQDKLEVFEKQVVSIMETFKRRTQTPQQQRLPIQYSRRPFGPSHKNLIDLRRPKKCGGLNKRVYAPI